MIRHFLLFLITALFTCAVYAQVPFDDMMLMGNAAVAPPPSTTVACDIGPRYTGAIPAAAIQAFGATPTCAANYDFTQTASFTDNIGTHTWSTISSWFSCGNAAGNWLFTYKDVSDTPCTTGAGNRVNIALDGGVQTLQLTYFLADKNNGEYSALLSSSSQVGAGPPPAGMNGIAFPQSFYIEHTLRSDTNSVCSGACIRYALLTYAPDANTGNPCFVSADFDEMWNTNPNGGLHMWNSTCGTSGSTPLNPPTDPGPLMTTTYQTYGSLLTNDSTAHEAVCNYYRAGVVNGLQGNTAGDFRSCHSYAPSSSSLSSALAHRMSLQLWEGPESVGQGGSNWTATSQTTFIQRVTVWACSGYASGVCVNNPVITTGAP